MRSGKIWFFHQPCSFIARFRLAWQTFTDSMSRLFNSTNVISPRLIEYCADPSNTQLLSLLSDEECDLILPYLTRIWKRDHIYPVSIQNSDYKLDIFKKLFMFERTNSICSYLTADFTQIHDDVIINLSSRLFFDKFQLY